MQLTKTYVHYVKGEQPEFLEADIPPTFDRSYAAGTAILVTVVASMFVAFSAFIAIGAFSGKMAVSEGTSRIFIAIWCLSFTGIGVAKAVSQWKKYAHISKA